MSYTPHGKSYSKEYRVWNGMVQRCTNPKQASYYRYGGRGITVCDEWKTFTNFYKDMGDCPQKHTLDRIDNNEGYSPNNCRWTSYAINNRNRRVFKNSISGIKGIYYVEERKKYVARTRVSGRLIVIGYYGRIKDAIQAREEYMDKLNKEVLPTFRSGRG